MKLNDFKKLCKRQHQVLSCYLDSDMIGTAEFLVEPGELKSLPTHAFPLLFGVKKKRS